MGVDENDTRAEHSRDSDQVPKLAGTNDLIAPPENGIELQKELGDRATLINVPGAAHLLPLE
jgi:hypothetical protein